MPLLEVLICTIDDGIVRVKDVLTDPTEDVCYLVSWQKSGKPCGVCPQELRERQDVRIVELEGKGLSANRNNAIKHAKGDILLISDDDTRYNKEYFDHILKAFERYPEADILTFQAEDYEGNLIKNYPTLSCDYVNRQYGSYIRSWEIAMRRSDRLPNFDERFGLGSDYLECGEEEVFIHEACQNRLHIRYIPEVIVRTDSSSTGKRFLCSEGVQRAKGGVLCVMHGRWSASLRCLKYAATLPSNTQRVKILMNMWRGICYIQRTQR